MSEVSEIEEVPEEEAGSEKEKEEKSSKKMKEKESEEREEERKQEELARRRNAETTRDLRERLIAGQLFEMRVERRENIRWCCRGRARRYWSIGVMLPAWIVTALLLRSLPVQESMKNNAMIAILVLCLLTLVCLAWSAEPSEPRRR